MLNCFRPCYLNLCIDCTISPPLCDPVIHSDPSAKKVESLANVKADEIPIQNNVNICQIYSTKDMVWAMKKENVAVPHSLEKCVRIFQDNSEVTNPMIVDGNYVPFLFFIQ